MLDGVLLVDRKLTCKERLAEYVLDAKVEYEMRITSC